jgi:putative ABC transport system substrate-binding protein
MQRRAFISLLSVSAAMRPLRLDAQQAAKPARIGYLGLSVASGDPRTREAFLQGLRDLGYVEGRNLLIEYRDAERKPERFPALAAELLAAGVDVIVAAGGTLSILAAKRATSTIPIVFTAAGDPVAEGLVASLARPGSNVTGLSFFAPDLVGKRLELLKQIVPQASLIALLLKPDSMPDRAREARLKEADTAARALGVRLQVVEARASEDFARAFSEMAEARAGALTVWATPVFVVERRRLIELAAKNRLPAISEFREFVEDGGLMSYGPSLSDLYRRAATYVVKILKGAKPADLPVEQPTRFELVINLKTAKALGLTVPHSLLLRADEVIE